MNDYQKSRFAQNMVRSMFNTVTGKKITLLGFAFKKNTGDTRETAAAYVAHTLVKERAQITVCDPQVTEEEMFKELKYTVGLDEESLPGLRKLITMEKDPYVATAGSHALAVLTEWDCFKSLDFDKIYGKMVKPAFVFDGRNILDHDGLRSVGFEVHAIGKPPPRSPRHGGAVAPAFRGSRLGL